MYINLKVILNKLSQYLKFCFAFFTTVLLHLWAEEGQRAAGSDSSSVSAVWWYNKSKAAQEMRHKKPLGLKNLTNTVINMSQIHIIKITHAAVKSCFNKNHI